MHGVRSKFDLFSCRFCFQKINNFDNTSEGYAIGPFNNYIEFTILSSRNSELWGEGEDKLNIRLSRDMFAKLKTLPTYMTEIIFIYFI